MAFAFEICMGFVAVALFLLSAFYAVSVYNGLVSLRVNIDKSWANIDVVLKQRSDLIPNLVEAVKGYMKYEKGVLAEITRLRTELMGAEGPAAKARASEGMSTALKSLFAVAESYPQLKANENFLELQKQLAAMENQIADRREFYNDSVMLYNTRIKALPDMLLAAVMGMREFEYFKAQEGEKQNIGVKVE